MTTHFQAAVRNGACPDCGGLGIVLADGASGDTADFDTTNCFSCTTKTDVSYASQPNILMQQSADCKDMISQIKAVTTEASDTSPQWTLISPDGKVWQGDLQTITRAVCQQQLKTNVP